MIIAVICMECLKLMTYDDITDWSEENIDIELYDDFDEWVGDIRENFSRHDHILPSGAIDSLSDTWENKKGEAPDNSSVNRQKRINRRQQNAQRKQFLKEELATKFRQQEQRIRRQQQRQTQQFTEVQRLRRFESKRAKRREKREKFTRRLSKKQRKKRGKRR